MLIIDAVQPENTKMSHSEFAKLYLDSPGKKVLYVHIPYCPNVNTVSASLPYVKNRKKWMSMPSNF